MYTDEHIEQLKKSILQINAQIEKMNLTYERKFTMDGHLIGSVGEVVASYYYDIDLYEPGHKLYDGKKDDKEIQIKMTQRDSVEVKGLPQYLIVLKVTICGDEVEFFEVYNGPGIFALKGKRIEDNKENSLSVGVLSRINGEVDGIEAIHYIKQWS